MSALYSVPAAFEANPASYSMGSLGVKRWRYEAFVEIKNEWSYASTSSYTFMAFTATISLLALMCLDCLSDFVRSLL